MPICKFKWHYMNLEKQFQGIFKDNLSLFGYFSAALWI